MNTRRLVICVLTFAMTVAWVTELRAEQFDVEAADHMGQIQPDGTIRWTISVAGSAPLPSGQTRVMFASPLGDGWMLVDNETAIRDDRGRLVGVEDPSCCSRGDDRQFYPSRYHTIVLEHDGEDTVLPALSGDAPERYWLENGKFKPADGGPLHKQIGSLVAGEFPERDRDRLETFFGEVPVSARPVVYSYAWPSGYEDGAGLVRAESSAAFRSRAIWFGGGAFLLLVLGVVGAMRWLRDDARAEAAEAYLREYDDEIAAL
ncbi:MAG: hypothetical protein ACQEVA_15265 [Myxococcota bacterium]